MTTLPPIQPHTLAKHHIFEYHLKEWFPILGRSNRCLQVIDGFAGPGRYEGGETGSPILALRAVKQHDQFATFDRNGKSVKFLFVEKDRGYYQHLQQRLRDESWHNAFTINVQHGEFERVFAEFLDDVDAGLQEMPPTLLFVDPFGPAGFPLSLFERLASLDRIDILINLNLLELVRWILPDPAKHVTVNRLYGGDRWKPALNMQGAAKSRFLAEEYQLALTEVGWKTTSFEMVNAQNQVAYHLVFATQHPKGLEAMKRAMRKASQSGTFRFSDGILVAQPVFVGLDAETEYARDIAELLTAKYDGQTVAYEELVAEEIDWHRYWLEKDLHEGLKQLESANPARISEVRKSDGSTRRRLQYPSGCLITFQTPRQSRLL